MFNEITIHGYLGRDPELKDYTNAKGEAGKLVKLSVGVSEDMGDKTEWFDVTFFGKRAEVIDKFFNKGSQILVKGRMSSSTVDKDGQKRKYWSVIGEKFDFCDSKGSGNTQRPDDVPDNFTEQEADIPF